MTEWKECVMIDNYAYLGGNCETTFCKENKESAKYYVCIISMNCNVQTLSQMTVSLKLTQMDGQSKNLLCLRNSMAPGPYTPMVSIDTDMKWCDGDKVEYFAILQVSATDAAAPAHVKY